MYIRNKFIELMARKMYFPLIKKVYKPIYNSLEDGLLTQCPAGSLGAHTLKFLKERNLEFFKGYEVHDLKHVLLGFNTDLKGEIMMQYFELGNGNRSLVVWIVIVFGSLLVPEYMASYKQAYMQGRQSLPLDFVKLETKLDSSLNSLRQQLHILK